MKLNSYFTVLDECSIESLREQNITFFDEIISNFPENAIRIIQYINDCYNYQSPYIIEEKDWETFLKERFVEREIPHSFKESILDLRNEIIVEAINSFLDLQKDAIFKTLVIKQNSRQRVVKLLQQKDIGLSDIKSGNDTLNDLDEEINAIKEELRQDQKRFGNYKGFDAVRMARKVTKVNIIDFVKK